MSAAVAQGLALTGLALLSLTGAVTLPTDLLASAVFMTGFPFRVHFTVFLQDPFCSVRIEFLRNDHKQSVLL